MHGRLEYVLAGPAMEQISIAEPLAASGETCASPQVAGLVRGKATSRLLSRLPLEYYQSGATSRGGLEGKAAVRHAEHCAPCAEGFVLLDADQWPRGAAPPPPPPGTGTSAAPHGDEETAMIEVLRQYIPGAVISRLLDGQEGQLAEMLQLSVVFVSITGARLHASNEADISRAGQLGQELMLRIQEVVYNWEGSVNKLVVDDKGLLVVCGFGLPPFSHHDDPSRATNAALDLVRAIESVGTGLSARIGVSTGRTFCGIVGSCKQRREYTIMGSVVNLSARLMGITEPGTVRVCEDTRSKLASEFEFDGPFVRNLKGMGDVSSFVPTRELKPKPKKSVSVTRVSRKLAFAEILDHLEWGRHDERARTFGMIGRLKRDGGGIVLITGGRGHGKTFLTDQVSKIAALYSITVLMNEKKKEPDNRRCSAAGTLVQQRELFAASGLDHAPLYPVAMYKEWVRIMEACVELGAAEDGVSPGAWIASALGSHMSGKLVEHLGLLSLVLPEYVAGDPTAVDVSLETEELVGDLLLALLSAFSDRFGATLIPLHIKRGTAIMNTQQDSWKLACRAAAMSATLIVVVATRSLVPADLRDGEVARAVSVARKSGTAIELQNFDLAKRTEFAAQVLSCDSLWSGKKTVSPASPPPCARSSCANCRIRRCAWRLRTCQTS